MPSIVAGLLASIVALVVEGWLRPYLGLAVTAVIGLALWVGVYYVTRNWLIGLRGQ